MTHAQSLQSKLSDWVRRHDEAYSLVARSSHQVHEHLESMNGHQMIGNGSTAVSNVILQHHYVPRRQRNWRIQSVAFQYDHSEPQMVQLPSSDLDHHHFLFNPWPNADAASLSGGLNPQATTRIFQVPWPCAPKTRMGTDGVRERVMVPVSRVYAHVVDGGAGGGSGLSNNHHEYGCTIHPALGGHHGAAILGAYVDAPRDVLGEPFADLSSHGMIQVRVGRGGTGGDYEERRPDGQEGHVSSVRHFNFPGTPVLINTWAGGTVRPAAGTGGRAAYIESHNKGGDDKDDTQRCIYSTSYSQAHSTDNLTGLTHMTCDVSPTITHVRQEGDCDTHFELQRRTPAPSVGFLTNSCAHSESGDYEHVILPPSPPNADTQGSMDVLSAAVLPNPVNIDALLTTWGIMSSPNALSNDTEDEDIARGFIPGMPGAIDAVVMQHTGGTFGSGGPGGAVFSSTRRPFCLASTFGGADDASSDMACGRDGRHGIVKLYWLVERGGDDDE